MAVQIYNQLFIYLFIIYITDKLNIEILYILLLIIYADNNCFIN